MAELKFTSKESGAQYVMIAGASTMLTWCVVSLATPVRPALLAVQRMVRGLNLPGWIMSPVKVERLHFLTVRMRAGV